MACDVAAGEQEVERDRMQHQARERAGRGRARPGASGAARARCCARAGAVQRPRSAIACGALMVAAPRPAAGELAAGAEPRRRSWTSKTSVDAPRNEADRKRRARADRRQELGRRQLRRRADTRRERRVGGDRLHHLGEQEHARQHRPAGKVPGERRMVGRDLDGVGRAARSRCFAPAGRQALAAAKAAKRAVVSLPVASRGSASTWTMRRGRKAASSRSRSAATMVRVDDARGDDEGDQPDDGVPAPASSGGSQNAPSSTPATALRWKSRWPSELRLPAMLTRSLERPSRRKVSRVDHLEHVGELHRRRHVAAAHGRGRTVAADRAGPRECATRVRRWFAAWPPVRPRCSRRSRPAAPRTQPRQPLPAAARAAPSRTGRGRPAAWRGATRCRS